jgi:hypothetical protein
MSDKSSQRKRWVIRGEAVWRATLLNTACRFNRSIVVTEFPKSGGTWLSQMLSEMTGYEFRRNQFPGLSRQIFHGHYRKRFPGVPTVVLWRDPRDIIVSWYHHCLFYSERTNAEETRHALAFADLEDIRGNLPRFIDYMFTEQGSPRFNWSQFFDTWERRTDVVATSYEGLRQDPIGALASVLDVLDVPYRRDEMREVVDRHSFERQAGRSSGEERRGAFLRKGIVGDWRNAFTRESATAFAGHTGDRIVRAGYEPDMAWIESLPLSGEYAKSVQAVL